MKHHTRFEILNMVIYRKETDRRGWLSKADDDPSMENETICISDSIHEPHRIDYISTAIVGTGIYFTKA